ncbi:6864_t:CDS:2 [Ambispora gerdemannii]|uniref:6864_t:CDS:1 n=1 Tax=Ambispora gerdemannii TaxID=144530 RepID=A0A9N9HFJ4_9GLOM|nr:6864_t:CDS:2 [Ambispora gerdemannii]
MEFTTHFELQSQTTRLVESVTYRTRTRVTDGILTLYDALFQGTYTREDATNGNSLLQNYNTPHISWNVTNNKYHVTQKNELVCILGILSGIPESAICVQRFDDSRNSAIHTTYRTSLRSSSMQEPRDPLLKVLFILHFRIEHVIAGFRNKKKYNEFGY